MPLFLTLASFFFISIGFVPSTSIALYYILIFFGGFFLGGPYIIVSSAITADLGRNPLIKGNTKAVTTVSGIIEGSGSLAAAIVQKIIPFFETKLFFVMAILSVVGGAVLTPTAWKEFRSMIRWERGFLFILSYNFSHLEH